MPTIKRVLPVREIRKQIRCRERAFDGRVVGTTHEYAEFNHIKVVKGRFLERSDDTLYRNCAVLAHATAEALFPYQDPIGETIALGSDCLHGRRRDRRAREYRRLGRRPSPARTTIATSTSRSIPAGFDSASGSSTSAPDVSAPRKRSSLSSRSRCTRSTR